MKVIRGAEIGNNHYLVLMKVTICGSNEEKRKKLPVEEGKTENEGGENEVSG